jgi:hypothetical protein
MKKTKQTIESFLGYELQNFQQITVMGGQASPDDSDPVTPSRGNGSGTIGDPSYPPPPPPIVEE